MDVNKVFDSQRPCNEAPKATSPSHPVVSFSDPDATCHSWAASLRPNFNRPTLPCRALNERAIEQLGRFYSLHGKPEETPKICIIGSVDLQRILGIRYMTNHGFPDRTLYPVEDIDVRVADDETLEQLAEYLREAFKEDYILKETGQHNIQTGFHIAPQRFFEKEDNKMVNNLFRAKVDLTASLGYGDLRCSDPKKSKRLIPSARAHAQEDTAQLLSKATLMTMTSIDDRDIEVPTLSDLDYLDSLAEVLNEERVHKERVTQRDDNKLTGASKIREQSLPLLLYMEATRKIIQPDWEPDEFCIRLLRLCKQDLLDPLNKLFELLAKNTDGFPYTQLVKFCRAADLRVPAPPPKVWPEVKPEPTKTSIQEQARSRAQPVVTPPASKPPKLVTTAEKKESYQKRVKPPVGTVSKKSYTKKKTTSASQSVRKEKVSTTTPKDYISVLTLSSGRLAALIEKLSLIKNYEQRMAVIFEECIDCDNLEQHVHERPELSELITLTRQPERPVPKPDNQEQPSDKEERCKPLPDNKGRPPLKPEHPIAPEVEQSQLGKTRHKKGKAPLAENTSALALYVKGMLSGRPREKPEEKDQLLLIGTDRFINESTPGLITLHKTLLTLQTQRYTEESPPHNEVVILDNDRAAQTQALKVLKAAHSCHSPYRNYLIGTLLLRTARETNSSSIYQAACQELLQAATCNITGAAWELLHLVLSKPELPLPASIAMELLKNCLTRNTGQQPTLIHRPLRWPCSPEDKIITTLANGLGTSPCQADWKAVGQQLLTLAQQLRSDSPAHERCRLLAGCALTYGGFSESASKCRISPEQITKLPEHLQMDWYLQGIPLGLTPKKLPGQLKTWAPAVAIQALIKNKNDKFNSVIDSPFDSTDWFWAHWLAHGLPTDTNLQCCAQLPELQKLWQHTLDTRKASVIPQGNQRTVVTDYQKPELTCPMAAEKLLKELRVTAPEIITSLAGQWRSMDEQLMVQLRDTEIQLATSTGETKASDKALDSVSKGIQLTAQALQSLNGRIVNEEHQIIHFDSEQCTPEAMSLLKQAVEDYANPYACWISARLHRAGLEARFGLVDDEKNWYKHYLGLLLFAATMGVDAAADDLMAELLEGKADALLIPICSLIARRYKRPFHLKLSSDSVIPCDNDLMKHLRVFSGPYSNQVWGEYLHEGKKNMKGTTADPLHALRLRWISIVMHRMQTYEAKPTGDVTFHPGNMDQHTPHALQASLLASLDYLPVKNVACIQKNLSPFLTETANQYMSDWFSLSEPSPVQQPKINTEDSNNLLAFMRWQPGTPAVTEANRQLHHCESENSSITPVDLQTEQLLRLFQCTSLTDQACPLPAHSERHMLAVSPWLALYQQLALDNQVTMVLPSEDLASQAEIIKKTDNQLLSELAGQSITSTLLQPFVQLINKLSSAKIQPEDTLIVLDQLTPKNARHTLEELDNLPENIREMPYVPLLRGFCLELAEGKETAEAELAAAGANYLKAAMYGVNNAVFQLARLALTTPNSPVAMERVLDMYILQRQRVRRHTLQFSIKAPYPCTREQANIITTLNRECIKKEPCLEAISSKVELRDFLLNTLIPNLIICLQKTNNHETRTRLNLLISYCFLSTGSDKSKALFPQENLEQLSHSVLHEWGMHLHFGQLLQNDNVWYQQQVQKLNGIFINQDYSLRSVPYILDQARSRTIWRQFTDWHGRTGSWLELPVYMGQKELNSWQQDHLKNDFCIQFSREQEMTFCSLPGHKENEHYQNVIHMLMIDSLSLKKPLRMPVSENATQRSIAQYWYDQYCIELEHYMEHRTDTPPIVTKAAALNADQQVTAGVNIEVPEGSIDAATNNPVKKKAKKKKKKAKSDIDPSSETKPTSVQISDPDGLSQN